VFSAIELFARVSHYFVKPDPDPHESEMLAPDPDPHERQNSGALEAQTK
jgi:hypothetical protein